MSNSTSYSYWQEHAHGGWYDADRNARSENRVSEPDSEPDPKPPTDPEPEPPVKIPPIDPHKPPDRPDPPPVEEPAPTKPGRWAWPHTVRCRAPAPPIVRAGAALKRADQATGQQRVASPSADCSATNNCLRTACSTL